MSSEVVPAIELPSSTGLPLEEMSPAEQLALLPEATRAEFLSSLPEEEAHRLYYDFFGFWARRKQVPPTVCEDPACQCKGLWSTLVILCGRGWG